MDKITTEEDAKDLETLKKFLKEKEHPVVERWTAVEEVKPEEPKIDKVISEIPAVGVFAPSMSGSGEGIKVTLKNAKVTIDRIIIHNKK